MIPLAAARGVWAPALSSNVARYYYIGDYFRASDTVLRHRALWELAWTQGSVLVGELSLVSLVAVIHAVTGWKLGERPLLSVATATAISEAVLIAYVAWAPWILFDYDSFHGDIISGALLLDQLPPASDPYTTIGTLLYCAAALGCLVIRALSGRASA